MFPKAYGAWFRASADAWQLGIEAASVMAMRMAKLAEGGDPARGEAELMVAEKVRAAAELQVMLATAMTHPTPLGQTGKAIKHYRKKVAANKRRLSRRR